MANSEGHEIDEIITVYELDRQVRSAENWAESGPSSKVSLHYHIGNASDPISFKNVIENAPKPLLLILDANIVHKTPESVAQAPMALDLSTKTIAYSSELTAVLARFGLGHYEQRLTENGFESWETVTGITEDDMIKLNFKLGDRRKLQRAIREQSLSTISSTDLSLPAEQFTVKSESSEGGSQQSDASRTKRAYRRHPRPDYNAPRRPKTAYVLFAEHVRRDPDLSHLSFANLARVVGQRWGDLLSEERIHLWEEPNTRMMQQYQVELSQYKQTENYRAYQRYLEDFKVHHKKPKSTKSHGKAASSSASTQSGPASAPADRESFQTEDTTMFETEVPNLNVLNAEASSLQELSPVDIGLEEVGVVSKGLGIKPEVLGESPFPPVTMTHAAVQAFLNGTGALLYLWNYDEAHDLVRRVYGPDINASKQDVTEVFAMAAVGMYCDGEVTRWGSQEIFLHFFLCLLLSAPNICELRRMRLFVCLAICRFTVNIESARRLMLPALQIGRNICTSPSFGKELREEEAMHWWNVFRSVVFLESWFAYNTGHESRVIEQDLNINHNPLAHVHFRMDSLQQRVSELGQLAAYIALDLKADVKLRIKNAAARFSSLNEWHRTLPSDMHLSRISLSNSANLTWHMKRSLLQLHILFLGIFIEPYRSFLVELGEFRLAGLSDELEDLELLIDIEARFVMAARQSARVASLLQADDLVRSHCWISVYTSFTASTILLFSATQKLLTLTVEEAGQDLTYACSHLNVLSLCSYDSSPAKFLLAKLQAIFSDIREILVLPNYRAMRDLNLIVRDPALLPSAYYDAVEGASEVSQNICSLARRVITVLQENLNVGAETL